MAGSVNVAAVAPEPVERGKHAADAAAAGEGGEHEKELVTRTREIVVTSGLNVDDVTDNTLLRFLKEKAMNPAKAAKLFMDDVRWRREYLGDGIPLSEIEAELKANKSYLAIAPGERPWVFIMVKNHETNSRTLETFKKFGVFVLEKAVAALPHDREKFCVVLDLADTQYKNLDARGILGLLDTLVTHYPERMHRMYVIHVPYIFWGVWKVVKPLIDPATRQKIVFVEDSELSETFAREMAPTIRPRIYGGQNELIGHWERYGASQ